MAAGPLTLHPALRSWYAAGLRHVYLDDEALAQMAEAREEQHLEAKSPAQTPSAQAKAQPTGTSYANRIPPRPQAQPSQNQDTPTRPTYQARQNNQAIQSNQARQNSQAAQAPQVTPQTNSQVPQGPQASTIPSEHWPKAWQERLTNTAKGAPVLWTYWALGEDLSGAPNAPRRDILRRILGELNLPRGTHCFWPIALPSDNAQVSQPTEISPQSPQVLQLEANAPLFLAGLNILAPRVCVIMGSKALRTILPHSTTGPFQQAQHGRYLFLVLPDMDMLLAESERIPRVIAYLRTSLQPFMR